MTDSIVQPSDQELFERVAALDPTSFENLALDLVRAAGFRNLVWRTPGADGGRDIEGEHLGTDPSGTDFKQKWYIECKKYTNSVDWPTLWSKIAYADNHKADFLLLITTSQPSPQCETEISSWNEARRKPGLRVWRGYDLPRYLRLNEDVAAAHGMLQADLQTPTLAADFALGLSKLVQAAHGARAFGGNVELPLTSAAALAELLHERLRSLSLYGRFTRGARLHHVGDWPWLSVSGDLSALEEVGFRALVAAIRHVLQAEQMQCEVEEKIVQLSASSSKRTFSPHSERFLKPVLQWTSCDSFRITSERDVQFSMRG